MTDVATITRPTALRGVEALRAVFDSHRYPRHFHDEWTFVVIDRGAAEFRLDRSDCTARSGQVVVIPPGVVHSGAPASEHGYAYRALYLAPTALAALGAHSALVAAEDDHGEALLDALGVLAAAFDLGTTAAPTRSKPRAERWRAPRSTTTRLATSRSPSLPSASACRRSGCSAPSARPSAYRRTPTA